MLQLAPAQETCRNHLESRSELVPDSEADGTLLNAGQSRLADHSTTAASSRTQELGLTPPSRDPPPSNADGRRGAKSGLSFIDKALDTSTGHLVYRSVFVSASPSLTWRRQGGWYVTSHEVVGP
jgi:hypothetical protein